MRGRIILTALITLLALVFGLIYGLIAVAKLDGSLAAGVGAIVFFVVTLPFVIWNNPKFGLYMIFASSVLFEAIPRHFSKALIPTMGVPFFWNFNNLGSTYGVGVLSPLKFSFAEMMMVVTALCWLVRSVSMRDFKFEKGFLIIPITGFITLVTMGFLYGISTGGDQTMAMWEVRSQYYFVMMYFLAVNLIKDRNDVKTMLWVLILSCGVKGLIGFYGFFRVSGPVGADGYLDHEESVFYNILALALFCLLLAKFDKKMTWTAAALTPFAMFAMLQNQRRAAIAAFIMAFLPLVPLLWYFLEQRRKQIMTFGLIFSVVSAIYLPIAWNGNGAWALPARAIRSRSDPSNRDAGSDYYRLAEEINLKATRDMRPWLGIGYGKPFAQVVALPEVTSFFQDFLPHNSVLWVWMRIGHIGFFWFWMIFAVTFIRGPQLLRQIKDPLVQVVGAVAIMQMFMLFTVGKYDVMLASYRVMVFSGALLGVLAVVHRIRVETPEEVVAPASPLSMRITE